MADDIDAAREIAHAVLMDINNPLGEGMFPSPDTPWAQDLARLVLSRWGISSIPVQQREFCRWCGTAYSVPFGLRSACESTCDAPPPADVYVYAIRIGSRVPDWEDPDSYSLVHRCKRGRPIEIEGERETKAV